MAPWDRRGRNFTMKFLISCATSLWVLLPSPLVWAQPQPGDYSPAKYEVVEALDCAAPMRDGVELIVGGSNVDDRLSVS